MNSDFQVVFPAIVPARVLTALGRAGVQSTAEVHRHIVNGTLRTLRGIGPYWENLILHYYTTRDDGLSPAQIMKVMQRRSHE